MNKNLKPSDYYYTIESKERSEIKIKGSRFIGSACPVTSKQEAIDFLDVMRREFYNATHNCFAYRLGQDGLEHRAADDGEPSGAAGKPILFSIQKADVTDVIVVVTRFFGGTKLGVGGLARAYRDSADDVLILCKKKPIYKTIPIKVFCTYEDISAVKRLIGEYAISFKENYHDAVEIIADIPESKVHAFTQIISDQTRGRAGAVIQK